MPSHGTAHGALSYARVDTNALSIEKKKEKRKDNCSQVGSLMEFVRIQFVILLLQMMPILSTWIDHL